MNLSFRFLIAPTFMPAAGVDLSRKTFDYLDGYSLFDVLEKKCPQRDDVLSDFARGGDDKKLEIPREILAGIPESWHRRLSQSIIHLQHSAAS